MILNHVSGSRHEQKLLDAVKHYCGIPVLGVVPRDPGLTITERHLGLTPSVEDDEAEAVVQTICDKVGSYLNLNAIVAIARQAPEVSIADTLHTFKQGPAGRIGVIMDRAFSFYYPEKRGSSARGRSRYRSHRCHFRP